MDCLPDFLGVVVACEDSAEVFVASACGGALVGVEVASIVGLDSYRGEFGAVFPITESVGRDLT